MSDNVKIIRPLFSKELFFDFHGVAVVCRTECDSLREKIRRDFSLFLSGPPNTGGHRISVSCRLTAPPAAAAPAIVSSDITPRRVVYRTREAHWVSYYQGEALVKWDFETHTGELWSANEELLHELAYLLILSRVGEAHDRRGLHRLHASGIAFGKKALLVVAPCGTGKTTLALEGLRFSGASFLSDDTPLVSASGRIFAFPSRLGTRAPSDGSCRIHRREHGEKWLTGAEAFTDRIYEPASPELLVFALRKLNGPGSARKVSKFWAFRQLAKALIAGVGVPQVVEYFLRFTIRDAGVKAYILLSRSFAAFALVVRSETWAIELGPDLETNLEVFGSLVRRHFPDAVAAPAESDVSARR